MKPIAFFGNARVDGAVRRGWFVGHFIDNPDDPRSTHVVEVKWGVHERGEKRPSWAMNAEANTLVVLIRGRFRIRFPDEEFLLSDEGDYVIWSPGLLHSWSAEEDSIVLTIRWPSRPGDAISTNSSEAIK